MRTLPDRIIVESPAGYYLAQLGRVVGGDGVYTLEPEHHETAAEAHAALNPESQS